MPAAVVLAGGPPDPRLAPGLPNKAFLVLGGRPLVARVVDALRAAGSVNRIFVVGPPDALRALLDDAVEIIPEQSTLTENMAAAARRLTGIGRVLGVASDIPLLTAESVERFLGLCTGDAGFYYPVIPQAAVERRFPGARKTFVRVADGVFCGGYVQLFDPSLIEKLRPLIERIIAGRKKPTLLAQTFGWSMALKLFAGTLSIAEMEQRVFEVTGVRAKAVIVDSPELALDVDAGRPENLRLLQAELEPGREA